MNQNIIRPFLELFKNCPKCGSILTVQAKQKDTTSSPHRFHISTAHDRLIINISSGFFVGSSNDSFEFSISVKNGEILYSDSTNHFISLYDLNIILFKDCDRCTKISPPETFHQSINVFYDRSDSRFVAEPFIEFFSFSFNDSYFYFANNFTDRKSFLSIQMLNHPQWSPTLQTPFIPFDKFDFKDKEKLFSKMNSIRLLA